MGRQWNTIIESLGPLSGGTMSINANLTDIEALLTTQQADIALIKSDVDDIRADMANGVAVSGTFWQATQPVSGTVTASQATAANLNATVVGSGSFTAAQATAANLNATVVQGTATNLKTQAENYQGGSAVGSGNPLQVTLANTGANSSALLVTNRGATGEATVSNFTSTTTATLKASNSSRKVLTIYNEGTGNLHVLYGSGTASTTNYSVKLFSGDYLEVDKYTGQVNAIFASAGTARVTEIT